MEKKRVRMFFPPRRQSEKFRRVEKGVKEEDVCVYMREMGRGFKKLYVCI